MKRLLLLSTAAIILLGSNYTAVADIVPVDASSLKTTVEMRKDIGNTIRYIDRDHYLPKKLDDDLSKKILTRYLKTLDPYRYFFLAKDIEQFQQYSVTLDNALKAGDADPAFQIYKLFRKRVQERHTALPELINFPFDFTKTESVQLDRSEADWAIDNQHAREIWRKRIKNDFLTQKLSKTEADEIRTNLAKRYKRQLQLVLQTKPGEVFEYFMNAFTKEIEPHTQYMGRETAENFAIHMSLRLEGIGASLQTDNDYTVVKKVLLGGPAENSNQIHEEDKIIGVGQSEDVIDNVIGWRLMDVVQKIRGKKGSKVYLQILPNNSVPGSPPELIVLTRDVIKLEEQAAKLSIEKVGDENYAVIEVPSFYADSRAQQKDPVNYRSTTNDVTRLIKEAEQQNVSGLIIDLRGNGGGFLNEAVNLTGLFIDQGPVVQVKGTKRRPTGLNDPNKGIVYAGPLLVMVDRYSASASEIFSGAIQDYGRGIVVGERTFGKGTVQRLTSLERNSKHVSSELKLTTAQFFRINGESTQHKGVIPNIILDAGEEDLKFGERAYDNALPFASVEPMRYSSKVLLPETISSLMQQHKARVADNSSFQYLRAENILNKEISELTELPLAETARKASFNDREIARLSLINQYRESLKLKPVKLADVKDHRDDLPDGDDHWKKVFQREASQILSDLLNIERKSSVEQRISTVMPKKVIQ